MSHRLKTSRRRVQTGGDKQGFEGASNIEALTLVKNDSERVSEESVTCSSPVCEVRFEQTGIERLEPRQYCGKECRMDAWAIRRTAKLLADVSDKRVLEILRRLSFQT